MKNRILLFTLVLFLLIPAFSACTSEEGSTEKTDAVETTAGEEDADSAEGVELTLEELADYDGKDGNSAYIAVDGIIYDVTSVPAWESGAHKGVSAGQDITEAINQQSPHGTSVLDDLPVVGTLVE